MQKRATGVVGKLDFPSHARWRFVVTFGVNRKHMESGMKWIHFIGKFELFVLRSDMTCKVNEVDIYDSEVINVTCYTRRKSNSIELQSGSVVRTAV